MVNGVIEAAVEEDDVDRLPAPPEWWFDAPLLEESLDGDGIELPPLEAAAMAVDRLAAQETWRLGDNRLLRHLDQLGVLADRLQGIRHRMITGAEQRKICSEQQGWTTADRIAHTDHVPPRRARATVKLAADLSRFPLIRQAVCNGRATLDQASAICRSLRELPPAIEEDVLRRAQQDLIGYAQDFDAAGLRRLGNHLVEVIAPDVVEDRLGRQLSRQERRAQRDRYLNWKYTGDGSIDFHGRLPVAQGETVTATIEAYAKAARGLDRSLDPEAEITTGSQRRADALAAIIDDIQSRQCAPSIGGDRPRAVITIQYEELIAGIRGAQLVGSGEDVSPGTARRMACDADVLPAVLGGPSTVLDLGRTVRLFTGQVRQALILRDGGCAFPGCDAPPARCEGHHLTPWWAGGKTRLDNGVLLCPHHHDIVEPDPRAPAGSRWTIELDDHGLPQVRPPGRIDPTRRPRRHSRFTERSMRRRR